MNYWDRTSKGYVTRRRLLRLAGSGGAGLVAIGLLGCGSSSDSKSTGSKDSSGLLTPLEDTTAKAKQGGTWSTFLEAEPGNLDARRIFAGGVGTMAGFIYSRFFKAKPGILKQASGEMEGDIISSWEFTNDGTQLVMKLNKAVAWDDRSPTNGRKLSTDDVKKSWNVFATGHPARSELSNAVSPNAPIESLTFPDAETVVMKLAFPLGHLLQSLGQGILIFPKEVDTDFDARTVGRGSGAWNLNNWQPSVSLSFQRNPKWHAKQLPFIDDVQVYIIPEYAQRLAQFRARRIQAGVVLQDDILATKRDLPDVSMFEVPISRVGSRWMMTFGMLGSVGKYLADDRVRQAFSMLYDRETFLNAFSNVDQFEKAGLKIEKRYHTHLFAGEPQWLDPYGKEMGDAAKYFKYDPTEAKKLLSAAGMPLDTEIPFSCVTNAYPTLYYRMADATIGAFRDLGLKIARKDRDYNADYLPNIFYKKGEYEGIGLNSTSGYSEAMEYVFGTYHPDGGRDVVRKGADPKLEADILVARRELDATKRDSLLKDIQRYMAAKQWCLGMWGGGTTNTFELKWPEAENVGVYNQFYGTGVTGYAFPHETLPYFWINPSKKA